jgi:dCMP deaminase
MVMTKEDDLYMDIAVRASQDSHAIRKQVGSCILTKSRGLYLGYNGTLPGMDNTCEDKVYSEGAGGWLDIETFRETFPYEDEIGHYKLVTRKGVVHSEINSLCKMAREGVSAEGATIYVTLSPCSTCSSIIASSGIKKVVYLERYRDTKGIEMLEAFGVEVVQYEKGEKPND